MKITDLWLPEFENEITGARKTLERVPEDRWDYRPHPKSMTLKQLAIHVANVPAWAKMVICQDELNFTTPYVPPTADSRQELLEKFEAWVQEARQALQTAEDADLLKDWSLLMDGKLMLKMPKVAVMRSFVFNHLVHHRAQLGMYLRLNDIPVPAIYGPSADEQG
jgi:uncharacterized damage-inducible protein DinB